MAMTVEIEGVDIWGDAHNDAITDGVTGISKPRVREGETRRDTWERIRRAARSGGMSRRDAYDYATRETDRLYAHGMAEAPEPFSAADPAPVVQDQPQPSPDQSPPAAAAADQAPTSGPTSPPAASAGGVQGLGDLPPSWPTLPPNASLAAEVQWVQANRLRVKQGEGVDLSRSLSPAPSHAALGWLETSLLYPSKFADVAVKASADQQDATEDVRRERLALMDLQALLAEAATAIP